MFIAACMGFRQKSSRFGKSIMSGAEINKAYSVITIVSRHLGLDESKVLGSLAKYISKQGLWDGNAIWQSCQHTVSATWWKGLCGSDDLSPVASKILQIPPTSAASERNWSLFGYTHTPKHATGWPIQWLKDWWPAGQFCCFLNGTMSHPQGWKVTVKMRPQSDVQGVDIEEVQGGYMEAWEEDNQSFSFWTIILQMYIENVFGMDHCGSFNIPYLLLFSEIIQCEESTNLIEVTFVTKLFLFLLEGLNYL